MRNGIGIKITCFDGAGNSTKVCTEEGTFLKGIKALDVKFRPDEAVEAVATFLIPTVETVASLTVTEAHLRELAAAHGYDLVAKPRS